MKLLNPEKSTIAKSLSDLKRSLTAEENGNKLILLMMLLNSADAFFTSLAIDYGVAEANPVMAAILKLGITWFLFNKLIIVNLLILFVGLIGKDYRIGRMGMVLVSCVYTLLTMYHLVNLSHLYMTGN